MPSQGYSALAVADPTLVWPALHPAREARQLALLSQLDRSQWWSPAALRAQQLRQAGALLRHAWDQVPFYRPRLEQAGFQPDAPLTEAIWARVPLLSRADLQEGGDSLHARALPPGHGPVHKLSSSGSTGQVVTVRGTEVTQAFWAALTLREHFWHQRDFTARLAAIRPYGEGVADYPGGLRTRGWGSATRSLFVNGESYGLNISCATEQQAEWLQRVNPDYLLTYPSTLFDLLQHCRAAGIAIPALRQVRTLSESLPPETRDLCREVWGLDITDGYSTQECGLLAMQCPEVAHYHVLSEAVMLEVLNEDGAACAPGEIGQIAVTSLHNFAMPLVRYLLGDMAELGGPCACGRGLPVLSRVLGRVRNRLSYPDGRHGWPMMGDIFHAGVEGIRQYQVIQHALDDIELRLAVDRPFGPEEEEKLRAWFHRRSGHPFPLRFSYAAEIPRGPGGKFETFKSHIS